MEIFEEKFSKLMLSKVPLLNRITHYIIKRKGKQMRPMLIFLFSKLLNIYVDTNIGMPSIEIMIISSILKKSHTVHYTRDLNDKEIECSDFIILPSSPT